MNAPLSSLAAVALLTALPAGAENVSDLAGLLNEPVVSTASKSAETAGLAPATTSVITGDDLRRHGIDSLHDAVNFLALGMLAESAYATPEIGTRGVLLTRDYGNHVLVLLDGHVVNEPWDGTAYYDWSVGIPLDVVDHIEVILGPGSVLYGSSAMLGVIHVFTKRARDYAGVHAVAEGSLPAAGHGSLGFGTTLGQDAHGAGLTVVGDYFRSQGPRLGYRKQEYDGVSWGGDATHRRIDAPSALARLVLGDFQVGARAALSRRAATQILGDFDDPDNTERDRWLSLDVRWTRSVGGSLQLDAHAYGDLYDYLANQPWTAPVDCLEGQDRCVYRASGVSKWFGGDLSASWDWARDGRFVTLVGGEVRRNLVTSWVDYRDAETGIDTRTSSFEKSSTPVAVHVQQVLRPARWISLNAGLRLDRDPELGSHLSPRAAVIVSPWTGGTLKAIYSEAFRAPTFYERFYADPTTQLQAGDLKPETVQSVEGVVEQRAGAQRLRLGVFRSWWKDLVTTVPATQAQIDAAIADGQLVPGATDVSLYANASRVDSYGLNADWEGSGLGQRLRYGASVTAAHSRSRGEAGDAKLPAAAQLFGNVRASYDLGGRLPTLALALRWEGARPVSGTSYDPVPVASPVLEGRAAVSGPLAAGLSYRLAFDWLSTGSSPYAVGPACGPENGLGMQPVVPLPRYRVMVGVRYDR